MFKELLAYYLEQFCRFGEPVLKTICNLKVPSMIILNEYKKLPPIEEMPKEEKVEMKKFVIEMFPEKTIQEKLDYAKIIYTIGSLL